jgi:DNA-directed RNA polymerase subunit L
MTSIKNVQYDKTKGSSRLEFIISGSKINYIMVNTLRRIILSQIPTYVFTEFTFNKNNSVFHNNFLKNQIQNLPVWGIDNKLEYFDNSLKVKNVEADEIEGLEDNVDLSIEKKVNSNSLEQLTMYVDFENKSNDIYTVTTDDAKFYFAQKQINNPYHVPIQLVKLQPKQIINFSVVTSVGIEEENSIYSPVSICVYDQKSENEFNFILESRGQLNEVKIINIATLNLIKKLENILVQIPDNNEDSGQIQINNEDHTLGNLITHGLQQHKNIKFAGYNMTHPLEKRVIINYTLKSGKIKETIKSVINDFIETFKEIDKKIEKAS